MTKDSPDKGVKPQVEEVNNLEAPPATEEKDSEETPKVEVESAGETKTEGEEAGEGAKKKGYSQRVRQLVKKTKKAEAKAQSLEEKLAELTAPIEQQVARQPIQPQQDEPIVADGETFSAAELDKRIKAREHRIIQRADSVAQLRAKQSEAITRINQEASEVLRDHPELDPQSDSFDEELSDSVTEATEAHVKANPYSASVKNFVAKQMKPYKRAVAKEVGKVTEKVARQASETALRPASVGGGDKKFEEKSVEEMEEQLGVVQ